MFNEEYQELDRSPMGLRRFGLVVGGVLLVIGALLVWREKSAGWVLVVPAGILLLLAAVAPAVLQVVHRGWMTAAFAMGWVMTNVILTLVFFLAVTPIGLLQRVFGKPPLELAFRSGAGSYWETRAGGKPAPADYEKQY
ncbi:hypothetical protein BH20VER2_BH20VER2_06340 [soil metagenome]|nr:hypothetical protein [Chthoniobacterales bacterium]